MAEIRSRHRLSVAARVLFSYLSIMLAFGVATGWTVLALRSAAKEARLVRAGYLPLALALSELQAQQDQYNTQLNHITAARNPTDIRMWFEFAKKGRPKKFGEVRSLIWSSFGTAEDATTRRSGSALAAETIALEKAAEADTERLAGLFQLLDRRDLVAAEALRDDLARSGLRIKTNLVSFGRRVQGDVDELDREALARERQSNQILLGLASLALGVGFIMTLYAQRVLRPLAAVTARAKAVAEGDLRPRPVLTAHDELGDLSQTFEDMVAAIAQANQQLLASERLATIGKMAAHVTHEVRNPLSSIALNLELLAEEIPGENNEAKALLRAIDKEVDRLTALSDQYLSMAKKEPPNLLAEDLVAIAAEAVQFNQRELLHHGVRATLESAADLPNVRVDEAQIRQALLNLMRNAREAMPSGGVLALSVSHAPDGGVQLCVEDEGEGMAAAVQGRVFEPFFTTKGRGTGLGLAVVKQIVTAHSATIECEKREPKGTRFRVVFPASITCDAPPSTRSVVGEGTLEA